MDALAVIADCVLAALMVVGLALLIVGAIEMFREDAEDPIAVMREERRRTRGAM